MSSLPDNAKARFLQCSHRSEVTNSRNLRHDLHRDPYLSNILPFQQLIYRAQILSNSILNILEGFFFSSALGPTAWQAWAGNAEAFLRLLQKHFVFHPQPPARLYR